MRSHCSLDLAPWLARSRGPQNQRELLRKHVHELLFTYLLGSAEFTISLLSRYGTMAYAMLAAVAHHKIKGKMLRIYRWAFILHTLWIAHYLGRLLKCKPNQKLHLTAIDAARGGFPFIWVWLERRALPSQVVKNAQKYFLSIFFFFRSTHYTRPKTIRQASSQSFHSHCILSPIR